MVVCVVRDTRGNLRAVVADAHDTDIIRYFPLVKTSPMMNHLVMRNGFFQPPHTVSRTDHARVIPVVMAALTANKGKGAEEEEEEEEEEDDIVGMSMFCVVDD